MAAKPKAEVGLYPMVRVLSLSAKAPDVSEALQEDPFQDAYTEGPRRLLVPPLGVGSLRALVEFATESNMLQQCVNAFQDNVDGFGHRLDLVVKDEQFPKARQADAQKERERLEEFFTYAYEQGSFLELRRRLRSDRETVGIGYWEVIRDRQQQVVGLNHLPAHTVRMTALAREVVPVTELRRAGLELQPVKLARRYRAFCQIVSSAGRERKVWFKEFGDPRFLHLKTGEYSRRPFGGANDANELIAFPVRYYALSPYSLPRWIGNLPSVLGSRAAEEINLLYFDNKTIPPMAVLVSGGQLTRQTVKRLEQVLEHEIKGREHFHKVLILEAAPPDRGFQPGPMAAPKIELKPLTETQLRDAMFLQYDESNRMKVRSSFGLAPIFVGESQDYTRATADISRLVVEEQVFRPERTEWDFWMNRRLMPVLGAQFLKFVSLGPNVSLNEDLIAALGAGESVGAMTPNLGRRILSDILEQELPPIQEDWGNVPFTMTIAQLQAALGLAGFGGAAAPAKRPELDPQFWRLLAKRLPAEVTQALVQDLRREIRKELDRRARLGRPRERTGEPSEAG